MERERQQKSGPSDFQEPKIETKLFPGMMEAGKAGGRKSGEKKQQNPVQALDYIEDDLRYPDIRLKARAIQEWYRRYADANLPRAVFERAAELRKRYGERTTQELGLEESEYAEIRQAMIENVGTLYANADPENSFKAFLNDQANRRGGFGRHFSVDVEKKLHDEYIARAELSMVQAFWDDIGSKVSPEYDAFADMSVAKVDTCRRISRETYKWLAEQGLTKIREDGKERKFNLTSQLNKATKILFDCITDNDPTNPESSITNKKKLNIWTTSGTDREEKIKQLVEKYKLDETSFLMAWQLATAECWIATVENGFVSHPAFRLVDFDNWRFFRSKNGLPVPGGNRLWVKYRQDSGSLPVGEQVYSSEGESFARVGYKTWPGGEQALRKGKYLSALREDIRQGEADRSYSDAWLPQSAVMLDIVKAADAFTKIEALGKTESKQFNTKLLADVKDKMVSALARLEDRKKGSAERTAIARIKTGVVLDEWAKSLLWLPSWANPANILDAQIMPTKEHVELFRNLITAFDDDGKFEFVDRNGILEYDKTVSAKGWGVFVGYGRSREDACTAAKNFIKLFADPFYSKTLEIMLDGKQRPNVSKARREDDVKNYSVYRSDYWLHKATIFGLPVPFGVGKDDRRWWLRG